MSDLDSKVIDEKELENVSGGTGESKNDILNWLYNIDEKLIEQLNDPSKNIKITYDEYTSFKRQLLYGKIKFNSIFELKIELENYGFEV